MKKERTDSRSNLERAGVRFIIDSYEEIFSEFDPRPLSERGFSGDFMFEADRAMMSKPIEKIDFLMQIPEKNRDLKKERDIKDRLKEYFKRHYEIMKKKKNAVVKKGIFFVVTGIILMFAATFLLFEFQQKSLLTSFLVILLEPGGWFLFWEGLDLVIFEAKEATPDLQFYKRMADANIKFSSA